MVMVMVIVMVMVMMVAMKEVEGSGGDLGRAWIGHSSHKGAYSHLYVYVNMGKVYHKHTITWG
jgi:hypothetical protein